METKKHDTITATLIADFGPPYVRIRKDTSAYIVTVHSIEQLDSLVSDLLHLKWLWEQRKPVYTAPVVVPNEPSSLPRPAMLEDDEADVHDFMHGVGEVN